MRCPKCQYIGFDDGDRCRNCGYEFTLAPAAGSDEELPLRNAEVVGSPDDFTLRGATTPAQPGSPARHQRGAGSAIADLPLFGDAARGERNEPLIRPGDTPRSPLVVRRPPHESPQHQPLRGKPLRAAIASRDPDRAGFVSDHDAGFSEVSRRTASGARREHDAGAAEHPAPLPRRGVAGAIDLAILAAIDLTVVYFTLRLTGLDFASVSDLPLLPLLGFLALLDGGYLVSFTAASGQTIGKMLTGVRVIADETERVPLGAAVIRAVAYGFSVLPLGIGCLPALFSPDRRAVHDRLAGTRVVGA